MHRTLSCSALLLLLFACSAGGEAAAPLPAQPDSSAAAEVGETEPAPAPTASPAKLDDDPGPPPAGCLDVEKDDLGFFKRDSGKGEYVGYVPKGYAGKPARLLVGLHGCGDDAYNFATWAVAPWSTRDAQEHIAISVDGASGGGNCWKQSDEAKVLAAIDDVARCFYVHRQKVVLAGFSSGGMLAYGVALRNAERFAGLLVLNATIGSGADALLASAKHKLSIAHLAHEDDSVFPIARVRSDWQKIASAGFPLETSEVPGGHDGTSEDWTGFLIPKMSAWKAP